MAVEVGPATHQMFRVVIVDVVTVTVPTVVIVTVHTVDEVTITMQTVDVVTVSVHAVTKGHVTVQVARLAEEQAEAAAAEAVVDAAAESSPVKQVRCFIPRVCYTLTLF